MSLHLTSLGWISAACSKYWIAFSNTGTTTHTLAAPTQGGLSKPVVGRFVRGLGATVFRSIDVPIDASDPTKRASTGSNSRFSTTWGAGLKIYANRTFGIQLDFKWTPTWIKSEPNGYWCDWYWGCFQSTSNDYANQWKFGGTLLARF